MSFNAFRENKILADFFNLQYWGNTLQLKVHKYTHLRNVKPVQNWTFFFLFFVYFWPLEKENGIFKCILTVLIFNA